MWNSGPQICAPTVKWSQWLRGRLSENKLEYSCVPTAGIGQISMGVTFSRGIGKKQGNPKGLWYASLYNKARARRHQVENIHVYVLLTSAAGQVNSRGSVAVQIQ